MSRTKSPHFRLEYTYFRQAQYLKYNNCCRGVKFLFKEYDSAVVRLGKKRTLIAVGHKILIAAYFILKGQVAYKGLGVGFLENKQNQIQHHIKRLRELGIDTEQLQVA